MKGDQFAPIDKPYMKFWRERLEKDTPRPAAPLKALLKKGLKSTEAARRASLSSSPKRATSAEQP